MRARSHRGVALLIALCLGSSTALSFESTRDQEISECRSGEIVTWGDGVDRPALDASLTFAYKHAEAPSWFSEALVTALLAKAAAAWSQCGIPARVVAWEPRLEPKRGLVLVQWSERDSGGNFGLANFNRATLSLGPKAFELLRSRNPAHDASSTLQMVIAHEMGHLFGLMAHSRRCVDVLSYYHNGRGEKCMTRDASSLGTVVEYRHSLPTACDVARCRIANHLPVVPSGQAASPAFPR